MDTNACYGGKSGAKAPVIPSLLAAPMLQGTRHDHGNTKRTAEQFIVGGRAWQDNSCGGPCVRNELIEMAFGDDR